MLFSSDAVAKVMTDQFEPVWVSVRDVPLVTIDFGGGKTITRTLNGNVATYALHPDGTVLDILPGIYQPEEYVAQLGQMALLYQYVYGFQSFGNLAAYHKQQAELLADGKEPIKLGFQSTQRADPTQAMGKNRIESPLKLVIVGQLPAQPKKADATQNATKPAESKAAETLRGWKEMAEDTKLNETTHRKAIHGHLAKAGGVQPKDVTKWLYKEVLHADLDDPYLGLGAVLNKNYPFADEDAKK